MANLFRHIGFNMRNNNMRNWTTINAPKHMKIRNENELHLERFKSTIKYFTVIYVFYMKFCMGNFAWKILTSLIFHRVYLKNSISFWNHFDWLQKEKRKPWNRKRVKEKHWRQLFGRVVTWSSFIKRIW